MSHTVTASCYHCLKLPHAAAASPCLTLLLPHAITASNCLMLLLPHHVSLCYCLTMSHSVTASRCLMLQCAVVRCSAVAHRDGTCIYSDQVTDQFNIERSNRHLPTNVNNQSHTAVLLRMLLPCAACCMLRSTVLCCTVHRCTALYFAAL